MKLIGERQLQARLTAIGKTELLMRDITIHGVREAKLLVPRKTTNLARTIRPGAMSKSRAEIRAGGTKEVGYAAAVELGTRPHIIRPRRKPMLAWPANASDRRLTGTARSNVKGPWIRAKLVRHPGTRAKPYLRPGLQKAATEFGLDTIVKLWNGAS